jgi:hypothetical protein
MLSGNLDASHAEVAALRAEAARADALQAQVEALTAEAASAVSLRAEITSLRAELAAAGSASAGVCLSEAEIASLQAARDELATEVALLRQQLEARAVAAPVSVGRMDPACGWSMRLDG